MRLKKFTLSVLSVIAIVSAIVLPGAEASESTVPTVILSQFKITAHDGQFVTLFNPTDETEDLSQFQLHYFNNSEASKATSNRYLNLTGTLPAKSYYMLSDSDMWLCYKMQINSLSLGFSSVSGRLELIRKSADQTQTELEDYVGWSRTATDGAQTLPDDSTSFLVRSPTDESNNPAVESAGAGSWQAVKPDPSNSCQLVSLVNSTPVQAGPSELLPASEPPAIIEEVDASTDTGSGASAGSAAESLPASDIGLMAPRITELLPNPKGTGNDATDEFIELYNPNDTNFDLTGFTLQSGLKTIHHYKFPAGTKLTPKSFTAFYSKTTGLSLSNTGSQVKLLDRLGNSVSASDAYSNAKDGEAWALANGKWYWTSVLTPNATNVIRQSLTSKSKLAKTTGSKSAAKSKSGSKTKAPTDSSKGQTSLSQATDPTNSSTPIHPWTLALIGSGALLYGGYEYRKDLANRFHQFTKYLSFGRAGRP